MPGPDLLPAPKTLRDRLLDAFLARLAPAGGPTEGEDIPGLDIAARTLWGETRGDPASSVPVAATLLNRLSSGKHGATLADVALEPKQFSSWNPGDPNRKKMEALPTDDPALSAFRTLIESMAFQHTPPDPTKGATMFHAEGASPKWDLSKLQPAGKFGRHKFFRKKKQ